MIRAASPGAPTAKVIVGAAAANGAAPADDGDGIFDDE